MNAQLVGHQALDYARRIGKGRRLNVKAPEKTRKLRSVFEHRAEKSLQYAGQLIEGRHFLFEKSHRFAGVRQRIVEFVGEQLFVLEKLVKSLARKKKRRKRQGIDRLRSVAQNGAQILHVEGHDVVAAHIFGTLAEFFEGRDVAGVKKATVGAAGSQINDFPGFGRHFGINKDNRVPIDGARQLHGTCGQSG